jgi:hypothetical protein
MPSSDVCQYVMSVKICIYIFFDFFVCKQNNPYCDERERSRTLVILAGLAKYLHWKFASLCHFKFAILCPQSSFPRTYFFRRFAVQTSCTLSCTLQRTNTENWKQIFPEKELRGHSPNFHIHVSVRDLYIPMIVLPILLQEICGSIMGIYKSLTDPSCVEIGKGIQKCDFRCRVMHGVHLVPNNVVWKSCLWYLSYR